jgi:hypothetical protein
MRLTIRGSDIRLASPLWPVSWKIPTAVVTNAQWYLDVVASVPDWLFYAAVGFAVASYVWDPFQKDSRLRQIWHWLFDRFEIKHLVINEPLSPAGDLLSVDLLLRFRKATKGKLLLRVFSCTGMAYEPREFVVDLGDIDEPRGGTKRFEIARLAIQHPGWDHAQIQGWIGGESLIAGSQNIAAIELTGVWPTQSHKFMVARLQYHGGETRPGLFVLDEEEDVFDGRRNTIRK